MLTIEAAIEQGKEEKKKSDAQQFYDKAIAEINLQKHQLSDMESFIKLHREKLDLFKWRACVITHRIEIVSRQYWIPEACLGDPKEVVKAWPGYSWKRARSPGAKDYIFDWFTKIDGVSVFILGAEVIEPQPFVETVELQPAA